MRFRSILPFRMPSRPASAGLGLIVFISMFGVNGCLSYKLTGIYVEPSAGACVPPGGTAQYTAYGIYTEGGHASKTEDITDSVNWTTDLPQLAVANSAGLVTASSSLVGYTDVKASEAGEFGLVWSSAQFTVSTSCISTSPAVISGLRILGDQKLASLGDTTQLVAVGHYSGAPWSRNLSQQVTWTSSNPEVAKVTPEGLVTATGDGQATVTAAKTSERGEVITTTVNVVVGGSSANQ